jgi:hypothetical protein
MATYSAGTYSVSICKTCPTSGGTYTVTSVQAPNPIYSNGGNDEVIQIQMVQLGGFNGLNN